MLRLDQGGVLDTISSELVDDFYKDETDLKKKRRVTAIVGASYLLHLKASEPNRMSEGDSRLLDRLLVELDVPEEVALELIKELEENGSEDLIGMFSQGSDSSDSDETP